MWATDVQVLRLSSIRMDGVKDEPGKAGAWEAVFVSPGKLKSKTDPKTYYTGDLFTAARSGSVAK